MQYTEDQKKAIEERGRNILVAAAAGSGKTRVLVDRIITRLLRRECSVDELLVVTFTNAAAAEMRERIGASLEKRLLEAETPEEAAWLDKQSVLLTGASISTFHVFHDQHDNIFTWSTTSKCLEEGETYHIKGTVKGHDTYRNAAQTALTRCSIC